MSRRPWPIPVIAAVAAVALFVAGVVVWRMYSALPRGTAVYGYPSPHHFTSPPHRLHPLRAELLWAASVSFALVAISVSLRQRRRPATAQTLSV